MTKFNVGDKVVPISKTVDWNTLNRVKDHLDESGSWNRALSNEQTYLYVNSIDKFRNLYICSNEQGGGGDYFHQSDLTPYKTKLTKNQRIAALENELVETKKEVAELKLIVHELRERPQLTTVINNSTYRPSTLNTVEDIIEFEGKQYRKVYREAQEGDVVIFRYAFTSTLANKPYKAVLVDNAICYKNESDSYRYTCEGWGGKEQYDTYELIKEGLNPHVPIVDETNEPLTPNQQRAVIIEKAKKFVKENVANGRTSNRYTDKGNSTYRDNYYDVDFFVKERKVTVVVYWLAFNKKRFKKPSYVGRAKCNPSDVFNEHIGKAISLGRALDLDVSEFEQAVQPTVAIGQLLAHNDNRHDQTRWKVDDLNDTGKNLTIIEAEFKSLIGETADGGYLPEELWYKIINDTNAIYEVIK